LPRFAPDDRRSASGQTQPRAEGPVPGRPDPEANRHKTIQSGYYTRPRPQSASELITPTTRWLKVFLGQDEKRSKIEIVGRSRLAMALPAGLRGLSRLTLEALYLVDRFLSILFIILATGA